MSEKIHLKGLNGIRAFAALAVVFSHIGLSLSSFGLTKKNGIDLAGFGVSIFFSLSGFLITFLLLREREKYNKISIRQFYMRRIHRIWPLYYFFIFVSLVSLFFLEGTAIDHNIIFYIFFAANVPFILQKPIGILAHLWSIGVEEQFYLFWPWLIKGTKKVLILLLAFLALFILLKFCSWLIYKRTGNETAFTSLTVNRFDCMAIGALGAVLYERQYGTFLKAAYSYWAQFIAWGIIVLLSFNMFHIASVIDHELIAVVAVILILNVATNPRTIIDLERRVPDYIGKISYGIYVYHPLLILLSIKIFARILPSYPEVYRYALLYSVIPLFTIFVSGLSYEYLEKPFLKLKGKYSRVRSEGSKVPEFERSGHVKEVFQYRT